MSGRPGLPVSALAERFLLLALGRSRLLRRMLQRWALRYAGRLLARMGGVHAASAEFLLQLGANTGRSGNTMAGARPAPRAPAKPAPATTPMPAAVPDPAAVSIPSRPTLTNLHVLPRTRTPRREVIPRLYSTPGAADDF